MSEENTHWDIEIKPKTSMMAIDLADLWRYRDLLWLFVRRDFVAQYKQTILGPVWHVVQPIFTTIIFVIVFGNIAKIPIPTGVAPVAFYLSGITLWSYFSSCLVNTSNTFVSNANIFGKVYFPRLILPLSIVISTVIRFLIQFSLLIAVMIWYYFHGYQIKVGFNLLYIPFIVFIMAGIGLGLGIIISSLTTKYRDLSVLVSFAVQLGMYITPIAYPIAYLSHSKYKWLIDINPLSSVVELFRYVLLGAGTFSVSSISYSVVFMIVVLVVGVLLFNKVEKSFMDTV